MFLGLALLSSDEERESFQKAYENNYLAMYHVAQSVLENQQDSENAVHDAFLTLADNYQEYMGLSEKEMTGFCVTLVKHKALDSVRKRKFLSDQQLDDLVLYETNTEFVPDARALQKERDDTVKTALDTLPEVFKETLTFKYYYRLDNKEIARLMNTTTKVVEMRLYRGKLKLREVLDGE